MMRKVILDCDPGNGFPGADIDDGLALGLVLKSAELQLEAVTVVAGNTPLEKGVQSGLTMLHKAGSSAPLYAGASKPLVENDAPWRAELDGRGMRAPGSTFWSGTKVPFSKRTASEGSAAQAIVRIVNNSPGEITVIAVGPLTNIAQAFMMDSMLPRKIAALYIMGGGFGVAHYPQELNFGFDPEAARIVLTSGAAIVLVPLDTTLKTFFRPQDNERLKNSPDPFISFLGDTCEPWIDYVCHTRNREGCALHDPLAVAALLDPTLVTCQTVSVDVELSGRLTRGRPVSWIAGGTAMSQGLVLPKLDPIQVAVDVDNARFVSMLMGRLLT